MTDFFLLFGLPRRPAIDLEDLKLAFARRNSERRAEKPDDQVVLNEAYRILADPVTRLDHLLSLESAKPTDLLVSGEVEEWFEKVAEVLHRFDQTYYQLTQESLHLLRAAKLHSLRESLLTIQELAGGLGELHQSLLGEVDNISAAWPSNRSNALPRLAQLCLDLKFTQKWLSELRERQLRFDELA
jgi:hypothetical protein